MSHNLDKLGRGVAIYSHKALAVTEVTLESTYQEAVSIKIKLEGSDCLQLLCIYRSPNSTDLNNDVLINDLPSIVDQRASHQVLIGDFNMPEADWKYMVSNKEDSHFTSRFIEKTKDLFLTQHITQPTRVKTGQRSNILDLIFSNEEDMIENIQYLPPLWSNKGNLEKESDHLLLLFDIKCYSDLKNNDNPGYDLQKGNYQNMRNTLAAINWEDLLKDTNIDQAETIITKAITKAIQENIPKRKVVPTKVGRRPIWMNRTAIRKVKKKHKAWQRFCRTRTGRDYENYISARNSSKKMLMSALKDYEANIAKQVKENPKMFWQYVNSKRKTRPGVGTLNDESGNEVITDTEKAELLNKYFSSVFTKENLEELPPTENPKHPPFKFSEITEDEILKKLKQLKPNKSPGPDSLYPKVLKEIHSEIAKPLTILFNLSISSQQVPASWKDANVIPIFKKGAKNKANNYRPVSLTSVLCKLLESCVKDQLMIYIEQHKIITDEQHGFLPHRSCVTQLLLIINHWTYLLDNNLPIDTLYLDFSKAFDSVPHERLLIKLHKYGISGDENNWFRSFLSNRKQRVSISGKFSSWTDVLSGVPQGSVIGPLLFLLFINDLPDIVHSCVKIFADDTKLYSSIENEGDKNKLQLDLNNAIEWSNKWQLPFNASKCKIMHLGPNNPHFTYNIDTNNDRENLCLQATEEEKDLGVLFDNKLSFRAHILEKVNKANQMVGLIKKTFTNLDPQSFCLLYKSIARPHLEYANVIWRPYLRNDINLIEKVQRRATKCIPTLYNLSYEDRLKSLRLPTLEFRRKRADMIQTFKIIHKKDNLNHDQLFELNNNQTRGHQFKLNVKHAHKNVRKHSFAVRVIKDWNSLPEDTVNADTLNSFKNKLDKLWEPHWYIY